MKRKYLEWIRVNANFTREKISLFFLTEHERSIKLKKNILISLILKGITVCLTLLIVSMTINYVNPAQYGIWLTLSSMITWFNFMDIGLANGLKNKLAEANSNNQIESIKIYLSTAYAILFAISVGVFVIFLVANIFLDWSYILNVKDSSLISLNVIAIIVMGVFCVQFFLQPLTSMLSAFHAASTVSMILAIGQAGCLAGIYLLTQFASSSLLYLTYVMAGVPLAAQIIATIWLFKRKYTIYIPGIQAIDLKHAKELLTTGGSFFFVQIGSLMLFQTDNIIVAQLFGPEEVTVFNLTYKLFSIVSIVFTIAMMPLWPAFTDAHAKNDIAWIEGVFRKMYKYFILLTVASVALLAFSNIIFSVWLGDNISVPVELSIAMTAYVVAICWMTIHCYYINAIGKMKLQMNLYFISIIVNIPLAIAFSKEWGLVGIALSNIFVVIAMGEVLRRQCKKIINKTATGIWSS